MNRYDLLCQADNETNGQECLLVSDVEKYIDEVEVGIHNCFDLLKNISSIDDLTQIVDCLDALKDLKDKVV